MFFEKTLSFVRLLTEQAEKRYNDDNCGGMPISAAQVKIRSKICEREGSRHGKES